MRRHLVLLAVSIAVLGCAPSAAPSTAPSVAVASAGPTIIPTGTPTATPRPTGTPVPTLPPGVSAWPKAFDIAMSGTYWGKPPFRIPFTITVDEPGWHSGHLHAEFIDIQRYDGMTQHQFPNRVLGFGDPDNIRGATKVDVAGLTPDAALDLLAARASLTTSNRAAVDLFGLTGARLDVHSATGNNPLFGGTAGDFGLGPELDVRLVLLPLDGRLFAVLVLAAPGDLDGAWEQALPILETVRLGD